MEIKDMKALLEAVPGYANKVVYFQWPENEAPALPFVCFFSPEDQNFAADNINYYRRPRWAVELYTRNRDLTAEKIFEDAFSAAGLYFRKDPEYLQDERCWMVVFTV